MTGSTPGVKKKARRDYDGRPGVTTVMGDHLGWSKGPLMGWAHKMGRKGRSLKERNDAAQAGSAAHAYAASLLGGDPFDESEWRDVYYVLRDEDDNVVAEVRIENVKANGQRIADLIRSRYNVIAIERAIIGESFGGTIDYVVQTADGRVIVLDVKTGKGIYDEVAVQLGAYAWLWRVDCARNYPPEIAAQGYATEGAVLHAPYDGELSIIDVSAGAMMAGEQIFRNLLAIHGMRDACKINGEEKE